MNVGKHIGNLGNAAVLLSVYQLLALVLLVKEKDV
jgi:hypothetical protein